MRNHMTGKKYRFSIHWYRQYDCWSIHYRGMCHKVLSIKCELPFETKINSYQPKGVVQGFASDVSIKGNIATIS